MTNEQKLHIAEFREHGLGYAAIASKLGLSKAQVSAYCRRNGLSGNKGTSNSEYGGDCCQNCGKLLEQVPGRKKRRFCSSECRMHWWNSHLGMVKRKAIYSFTCLCCGASFTAYGNANRKYCSHSCYIADRFGHDR